MTRTDVSHWQSVGAWPAPEQTRRDRAPDRETSMMKNKAPSIVGPDAPGGIVVEISDTQAHLAIDPEALARLVRGVLTGEGVERAAISLALVDDATIRDLNERHLNHDWPTD